MSLHCTHVQMHGKGTSSRDRLECMRINVYNGTDNQVRLSGDRPLVLSVA